MPAVKEYILTSMLKRVDVAVYEVIKAQIDGTFTAGRPRYDLSVDGVGYSTSGGFVDDIVDQLEAFKADDHQRRRSSCPPIRAGLINADG